MYSKDPIVWWGPRREVGGCKGSVYEWEGGLEQPKGGRGVRLVGERGIRIKKGVWVHSPTCG